MNSEITPKLGVIDSIASGFRVLARFPWLILVPVLLDVALWLGPQLSVKPLITPLAAAVQAPPDMALSADYQQALETSRQLMTQFGDQFNLLSFLANGLLGVPSLAGGEAAGQNQIGSALRVEVPSVGALAGWLTLLMILSVVIGAVYLVLIAQHLRAAPFALPALARSFVRTLGRLLIFTLLIGLLLLAASLPLALLSGLLALVGGVTGTLLAVSLIVFVGWWVRLGFTFIVPAMVLDEVGVRHSIWRSINLVTHNLFSTMGLVILLSLIGSGFSLVWQRLAGAPLGVAIGILGNATLGTGLLISVFIYYRDCVRRWQARVANRAAA